MFSQILTAFQGFFSRSFWFGSFLPVAVIAALHLAIVNTAFPGLVPIKTWMEAGFADSATGFLLLILGLVVLAYTLTPFTPLVRSFLDGQLMPDLLHDWLRQDRRNGWRTGKSKIRSATIEKGTITLMQKIDIERFWEASRLGNALRAVTDKAAIDKAVAAIGPWRNAIRQGKLPDHKTAREAIDCLIDTLSKNASDLPPTDKDAALSQQLARAKNEMIDLIREAHEGAEYRITRMNAKYYQKPLYPTRVRDARWAAERYSEDTYHVDFDFIWSRIQLLLKKDENIEFLQRLADSRSQVDSAVLTLTLTLTVPLFWLPTLLFTTETPWLFLAIGLITPIVLTFLYELVVQSQLVFGEVVRVAIDQYRLDVLTKMMRQPMPATLAAERSLWEGLNLASQPGNEADLSYRHPV